MESSRTSGRPESLEIREYQPGDAPAAVALLNASFGEWPGPRVASHDRPLEFFDWKHHRNPVGPSAIFLAEADGLLVGIRAYMPWPLVAGRKSVEAVQGVDVATHPDHRGRGVNRRLTEHALAILRRTTSFSLGLPNEFSRPLSRSVGWRPVGPLPVRVRVRRPARVALGIRSLWSAPVSEPPPVEAVSAVESLQDGAEVAALLGSAATEGSRLRTRMDVDHLRWRYEPFLGDYRAVVERSAGKLTGLAIFRARRRGRLLEGAVCELVCEQGDPGVAKGLLAQVAAAAPFDYLVARDPPAGTGFVRSPVGRRPLGVNPYVEGVVPDPTERRSWALSLGDLERLSFC